MSFPQIVAQREVHLIELRVVNDQFVESTKEVLGKMQSIAKAMAINRPGLSSVLLLRADYVRDI